MRINQGLLTQYENQSLIHALYGDRHCIFNSYENKPCILNIYVSQPWIPTSTRKSTTDSKPYVGINIEFPPLFGQRPAIDVNP